MNQAKETAQREARLVAQAGIEERIQSGLTIPRIHRICALC